MVCFGDFPSIPCLVHGRDVHLLRLCAAETPARADRLRAVTQLLIDCRCSSHRHFIRVQWGELQRAYSKEPQTTSSSSRTVIKGAQHVLSSKKNIYPISSFIKFKRRKFSPISARILYATRYLKIGLRKHRIPLSCLKFTCIVKNRIMFSFLWRLLLNNTNKNILIAMITFVRIGWRHRSSGE